MQNIKPLDAKTHALAGWRKFDNYGFTSNMNAVPVIMAEIPMLIPTYTLAFKRQPGGEMGLVAVTGLGTDNLMVGSKGQWLLRYVPSLLRCYPFSLLQVAAGPDKKQQGVLSFDFNSNLFLEKVGDSNAEERFFDDEGKPSSVLQKVLKYMISVDASKRLTDHAVRALESCNLLVNMPLPGGDLVSEDQRQTDLFRIDDKALRGLSGAELETLNKVNALTVAYAQMFSVSKPSLLRNLHESRSQTSGKAQEIDLDSMFNGSQGDDLSFSFD